MYGFIEFKEDTHHENVKLAHRIKEEVCQLFDNLSKGGYGDRHYEQQPFDERRGGGQMGNRGSSGGQMGNRQGGYSDRRYILDTEPSNPYHQPYPHHYPQHFDQRQMPPQGQQFDDRYNY